MLKPMKFNSKRVWFTADLHLNHGKDFIYQRYGVTNEADYRLALQTRWNARVWQDDPVFLLGDTVMKDPEANVYYEFLPKLNGKFYILFGNHNSGLKEFVGDGEVPCYTGAGNGEDPVKDIAILGHYAEILVHGQYIVLCHYPILTWNDYLHGTWMLHGHNHGRFPDEQFGKIVDVGLDNYPDLVSFDELKVIMSARPVVNIDTRPETDSRSLS